MLYLLCQISYSRPGTAAFSSFTHSVCSSVNPPSAMLNMNFRLLLSFSSSSGRPTGFFFSTSSSPSTFYQHSSDSQLAINTIKAGDDILTQVKCPQVMPNNAYFLEKQGSYGFFQIYFPGHKHCTNTH